MLQTTASEFHDSGIQEEDHSGCFFEPIIPYFNEVHLSSKHEKEFYNMLSNRMGELYTLTLGRIEEKLIKEEIGVDDLKVNFSKTVLLQILNLVNRLQTKSNWKNQRVKFF